MSEETQTQENSQAVEPASNAAPSAEAAGGSALPPADAPSSAGLQMPSSDAPAAEPLPPAPMQKADEPPPAIPISTHFEPPSAAPIEPPIPAQTPPPTAAPQPVSPVPGQAAAVSAIANLLLKAKEKIQARKRKKLEKVLVLAQNRKQITNNDVEKALKISDKTAERFLNQLIKEGKLRRIGKPQRPKYEPI